MDAAPSFSCTPEPATALDRLPRALAPLIAQRHWCVWKWEVSPRTGKRTKVPYIADAPNRKARNNAPSTWRTYEVGCRAVADSHADGIGFMLSGSGFAAFDLDDCRDPMTEAISSWALALVEEARSYVEVTVSGTGLRIIGTAEGEKVHRKQNVPGADPGSIETYRSCERFIVVTGDSLDGGGELTNIDAAIDHTVARLDEAKRGPAPEAPRDEKDDEPQETLPPTLERLIRFGVPEGQRSEQFMHAVGWLKQYGWDVPAIVALLEQYPGGIAEKYAGRLEAEVERCFAKASGRQRWTRPAADDWDAAPAEADGRERRRIDELVTEDDAALAFAAQHADRLRYCHDTGAWFEWTGAAWRQNRVGLAFHWARELARELSRGADAKARPVLGKTAFAGGVERFARYDPTFAVTHETWDNDPWLLGTPGGTVDLRTGELREPNPSDGITKLTAVAPSAVAHCPTWLAFLDEATKSDPQMVRLLRQLAGYSLTGDTSEQKLAFLEGGGGNGKGVFVGALQHVLGAYAVVAAMETFIASVGDKHPTDLAMLRGARLVTASETEEGRAWAESRIKQMTGGDPITARFMRQDFFTYVPQFKLLIMGNNKPNLKSVDDAMRRRFIILPFHNRPARVDPLLPQKLRMEAPGILRWMIEGCLDWQQNGLVRSTRDREATDAYFSTQDLFGQWLAEACDAEPGNEYKRAGSGELFSSWRSFAAVAGETPGSTRSFAERMEKRGFEKKHSMQGSVWIGIRLQPPQPWQEAAE